MVVGLLLDGLGHRAQRERARALGRRPQYPSGRLAVQRDPNPGVSDNVLTVSSPPLEHQDDLVRTSLGEQESPVRGFLPKHSPQEA